MYRCCFVLMLGFVFSLNAQNVYFVDGYHGGIYGHYPVKWKTAFILDNLNKYPDWKICLEIEPETWDSVKRITPVQYNQFKNISHSDRLEFTNPTYAQPYCYNISGESIIRQFQYGIKKINNHFPGISFNTYSVEEPCFTSSLPQILKSFGFNYAVLKCPNTCWGGYTSAYGKDLVNWIGPDGTSLVTVPRYGCEDFEDNSTWQTKAWINSPEYINACFSYGVKNPVGMCFQDAGWKNGPWLGFGAKNKSNSVYVTWKEYFEKISDGKTADNWHFTQEDVRVNLMWGSQVLQKIAQQVRHSENTIIQAEKLSAMAYLANGFKPDQKKMDEAWRTLMLAQHHDSWIVPYNRLNKNNTWADEIAVWTDKTNDTSNEIMQKSLGSFENATAGNDYFIRVYNTVGFLRNEVVTLQLPENLIAGTFRLLDADKKDISYSVLKANIIHFQAKIPAFGYATYQISKVKSVKKVTEKTYRKSAKEFILENDMYKIVFDLNKGGTIKSLVAKAQGNKEYAVKQSELLLGEIRGFFYEQNKFRSSAESKAKVTLVENNAHKSTVRISGHIASHPFDQTVTISAGSAVVDFDLNIKWKHNEGIGEYKQQDNWQENRRAFCNDRYKLNIWFPVDLRTPKLYKNAPFDVCESRLNNTTFNTWDSIKHNVILNWIDLLEQENGAGLALFIDHTTSYTYGGKLPLGLTIQYSGKGLWGPDYKITGTTKLKYALVPHSQKWDKAAVQSKNTAWNEPLIAKVSKGLKSENRSFIDLKNSGYELSAVQITENGVLMRLFNTESNAEEQKVDIGFRFNEITEVELNGTERQSDPALKKINANELTLGIPQFGIRNFYFKN